MKRSALLVLASCQCRTDGDCEARGGAFAGSICEDQLQRALLRR